MYAFGNCTGLKSITIGTGVTEIAVCVFSGCTNLQEIVIPIGVTKINGGVFQNCTSLTNITFNGKKAEWNTIEKVDGWDLNAGSYTIHCTDGDIAKS